MTATSAQVRATNISENIVNLPNLFGKTSGAEIMV